MSTHRVSFFLFHFYLFLGLLLALGLFFLSQPKRVASLPQSEPFQEVIPLQEGIAPHLPGLPVSPSSLETLVQPSPLAEQELKTDDGTVERGAVGDGLLVVNRLTPSTYPAKLLRIRIRWDAFQTLPSPLGERVRLVVFTDPGGSGRPPANPAFAVDEMGTISQTSTFLDFTVSGPTISSGDFYVGFQAPNPARGVVFSADTNGPQQYRAFFSSDNGTAFQGPLQFSDATPANILMRALVTNDPGTGDTEELKTDDGTSDGKGLLENNLLVVNRLTPGTYPVTLTAVRLFLVSFQGQPSPVGSSVRVVAFVDPTGSGKPPANPVLVVNQPAVIPKIGEFVDVPVNSVTVTAGDVYVGYQAGNPHNGVGFACDTNGPPQNRAFFSRDGGGTFSGPLQFSDGTQANVMVRATVKRGGGSGGDTQAPTVRVTAPNGGETFTASTATAITWTASDNLGVVRQELALSLDSGGSFPIPLVTGLDGNTRQWNWTVPNSPTTTARLKVTALDAAGNSGFDTSDQNFSIRASAQPPTILLSALQATVYEMGVAQFGVMRRENSETEVKVHYSVSGSAVSGVDFAPLAGVLTLPAKATSGLISVLVLDNAKIDPDRTITLTLTPDPAYQIGSLNSATSTIKDTDKQGSGTIQPAEGGSIATDDGASVTLPPEFGTVPVTVSLTRIGKAPKKKGSTDVRTISWTYRLGLTYNGVFPVASDVMVTVPLVEKVFPTDWNHLGFEGKCYDEKNKQWVQGGSQPVASRERLTLTFLLPIATLVNQGAARVERFLPTQTSSTAYQDFKADGIDQTSMLLHAEPGSNFVISYFDVQPKTPYSVKSDKDWNSGTRCSGTQGQADTNYVRDLDSTLNASYTKLLSLPQAPFKPLSLPQPVYVKPVSGGDAGESPLGGPMTVSNTKIAGCTDLKEVAAHELVHVFQGQFYSTFQQITSGRQNRWFIEASANHYAALATGMGDSQKRDFYKDRGGSLGDYLSEPLTSSSEASMYAVAHFLDWLADRYTYDIVGVTLRKRSESSSDLTNLNQAIQEFQVAAGTSTNQTGLAAAYAEYVKEVITHPEGTAGFNQDIKGAMSFHVLHHAAEYLSVPAASFNDLIHFIKLRKPLPPYTSVYLTVDSKISSKALLVLDPTGCSGAPLESLTYDFVGKTDKDYENKDPLDKNKQLGTITLTVEDFGKGQTAYQIEQAILNGTPATGTVEVNYYLLVPPVAKEVRQGSLVWEFSGVGKGPGLIPPEFIKGFNVYDTRTNSKLNPALIALPSSGTEQALINSALTGALSDYLVTIVDKFDHEWPKAPISDIQGTDLLAFGLAFNGTYTEACTGQPSTSQPGEFADYGVPSIRWDGKLGFSGTVTAPIGTGTYRGQILDGGKKLQLSVTVNTEERRDLGNGTSAVEKEDTSYSIEVDFSPNTFLKPGTNGNFGGEVSGTKVKVLSFSHKESTTYTYANGSTAGCSYTWQPTTQPGTKTCRFLFGVAPPH